SERKFQYGLQTYEETRAMMEFTDGNRVQRKILARNDFLFEMSTGTDEMNLKFGVQSFDRTRDCYAWINMPAGASARDYDFFFVNQFFGHRAMPINVVGGDRYVSRAAWFA